MKPVLLVDFGSTNTKVTAVDVDNCEILGTAAAYTTVETDINNGLHDAIKILGNRPQDLWNMRNAMPAPALPED
ncbi:MAG: glutamate mutase L [Blautia producta]